MPEAGFQSADKDRALQFGHILDERWEEKLPTFSVLVFFLSAIHLLKKDENSNS